MKSETNTKVGQSGHGAGRWNLFMSRFVAASWGAARGRLELCQGQPSGLRGSQSNFPFPECRPTSPQPLPSLLYYRSCCLFLPQSPVFIAPHRHVPQDLIYLIFRSSPQKSVKFVCPSSRGVFCSAVRQSVVFTRCSLQFIMKPLPFSFNYCRPVQLKLWKDSL